MEFVCLYGHPHSPMVNISLLGSTKKEALKEILRVLNAVL
jgi:hypothetical protein